MDGVATVMVTIVWWVSAPGKLPFTAVIVTVSGPGWKVGGMVIVSAAAPALLPLLITMVDTLRAVVVPVGDTEAEMLRVPLKIDCLVRTMVMFPLDPACTV